MWGGLHCPLTPARSTSRGECLAARLLQSSAYDRQQACHRAGSERQDSDTSRRHQLRERKSAAPSAKELHARDFRSRFCAGTRESPPHNELRARAIMRCRRADRRALRQHPRASLKRGVGEQGVRLRALRRCLRWCTEVCSPAGVHAHTKTVAAQLEAAFEQDSRE